MNGNATQYEYDAAGNVTAVTDAEGRRVTFAYDLAGRMTETVYPDGSKDTTEYNLLGYCQELCAKSVCRLRLNEVSQQ